MDVTIVITDDLLHAAEERARDRRLTLDELVEAALRRELSTDPLDAGLQLDELR